MEISPVLILAQALNFVILMLVLTFLYRKFLHPFMLGRAEELKNGFEQVELRKKEIEKLKQDYLSQTQDMRAKTKEEMDKAILEGKERAEDLVVKAQKEAVALIDRARGEIEGEKRRAITDIQKEVAQLSIKAARVLMKKEVDTDANSKLVQEFLAGLEKK